MGDGVTAGLADLSVAGILGLARGNAAAKRRTYAAIGEKLIDGRIADVALTDWQRSVLSQLLRQVVGDIYSSMRWLVLAELENGAKRSNGKWSDLGPDGEAQVFSKMSQYGLLTDAALIEAITHRLYQHQLEQATRPPDRNSWTNGPTLEDTFEFFEQPLPESSPVNRKIAAYIVDRSRRTDRYGNPVLLPNEIEAQLYERLHWQVAAVLRQVLCDEDSNNLQKLDSHIETAALESIRHSLTITKSPTNSVEASRALESADLLNIDTVYRLIKAGEIALFEDTLARLAGIRPILLRRLLYEAGGECFAVLIRALDVEFDQALSIFALTRSGSTKHNPGRNTGEPQLKAIYGAVSVEDANLVRAHWMRQPGFASALREAETNRQEATRDTLH